MTVSDTAATPRLTTLPLEPRPLDETLLDEGGPVPEPQPTTVEPDAAASGPWLVVVDPQRVFAEAGYETASPDWPDAVRNVKLLAARFEGRVVITRWADPDRPEDDMALELVPEVREIRAHVVAEPTPGKWHEQLRTWVGHDPELVVTGVPTESGVLATALAAADDGARVTVVPDACAGTTPELHAAALAVVAGYPRVTLAGTDEVLG